MYFGKAVVGVLLFYVVGQCYASEGSKIFNALREVNPPNKYPWAGWILIGIKRVKCGAVLVAPGFALTAASCAGADIVSVIFGDHNRTVDEGTEQVFSVSNIVVHPDYSSSTYEYDVAILVLDRSAIVTAAVEPIPPLPNDTLTARVLSKHGRIMGWGYVLSGSEGFVSDQSDVLLEVTVDVSVCATSLTPSTAMCYEPFRDPTSLACEGDTGNGHVIKRKGVWTLAGIMSGWNVDSGCQAGERASTLIPVVYDWISETITSLAK